MESRAWAGPFCGTAPRRRARPEPIGGLLAELVLRGAIGRPVLAPGRGGQRGGAGGVVGVSSFTVRGQLGVVIEGLGPEPRGAGIALRVGGAPGKGEAFGVVPRSRTLEHGGQSGVEGLEPRIAGLQLIQRTLGFGRLAVVAQAASDLDEITQVVRQKLPVL